MAAETNAAGVLHAKDKLCWEAYAMPECGDDQVLVRMKTLGICGSDVHYWTHGSIGPFVVNAPMVIGHESAGIVAKVGSKVSHLKPGDRVALEPGVPCATCSQCREGRYNLCPDMRFFATPPIHGSLARFVAHPAAWAFKIPEGVSLEEGALTEPMAVGVHACKRGGVTAGSRVLVLGAGPIGIICAQTAKAFGASFVAVTDVNQRRLDFALAHKMADAAINVTGKSPAAVAAEAGAAAGLIAPGATALPTGIGFDCTIECCGFSSALMTAILAARGGAAAVLVGMGSNEVTLPLLEASVREVDLRPIFRYRNCYAPALELMASKAVNLLPLVSHRLGAVPADLAAAATSGGGYVRAAEGLTEELLLTGFGIARDGTSDGKDSAVKVMFHIA